MKIKLKRNANIKRANYTDRNEYIFDKKTNVVPKKTNRLVCLIFGEDKTANFILRKINLNPNKNFDFFRFKKGMYIINNESIHITANNIRMAFYLEGISTPLSMSNIEHETVTAKYKDLQGHEQTSVIEKIKGLKFDAKILDIFANRRFAEIFTRSPMKNFEFYLLIIGIISLVMIGIGYGVTYAF